MSEKIAEFKKEIQRVGQIYISKVPPKNDDVDSSQINTEIAREFINKGVIEIGVFANKLFENENENNIILKKELEEILEAESLNIIMKITYS
ncbi:hypothetical protein [Lacinutrix sp. MEBiC02404]